MATYVCGVCNYEYVEEREGRRWNRLDDDWRCPVCNAERSVFEKAEEQSESRTEEEPASEDYPQDEDESDQPAGLERTSDDLETHMADIHRMARTGESVTEPMRTNRPVISWDDILIMGAQLARLPLNENEPVTTRTVIGPAAARPLVIDTPVYISHMSFGALSREAKLALARGSARTRTAMCSGEGGILPESLAAAYRYIFEYVPNRYSVTDENLRKVDAVEIKIGQSAKPGMGGYLPPEKVTDEIAAVRGKPAGEGITSPARFGDINSPAELKRTVASLRERSEGCPVGIKLAAGHIEDDLKIALDAEPDFITIDGRPGATGSASRSVKDAVAVPTPFALYRARTFLDKQQAKNVSLVITGGLRTSADFAKALALGADAVAIGTAALMAIGCQQYRTCHTNRCPMGIATQDPELRRRFNVDRGAKGLTNYLNVCTEELKTFARLTGNDDLRKLYRDDLRTTNSEISDHTAIRHV